MKRRLYMPLLLACALLGAPAPAQNEAQPAKKKKKRPLVELTRDLKIEFDGRKKMVYEQGQVDKYEYRDNVTCVIEESTLHCELLELAEGVGAEERVLVATGTTTKPVVITQDVFLAICQRFVYYPDADKYVLSGAPAYTYTHGDSGTKWTRGKFGKMTVNRKEGRSVIDWEGGGEDISIDPEKEELSPYLKPLLLKYVQDIQRRAKEKAESPKKVKPPAKPASPSGADAKPKAKSSKPSTASRAPSISD